jgi:putative transposase
MKQIARMSSWRDGVRCGTVVIVCTIETAKITRSFRAIIASGRVERLALPVRSPDLNAYSERWVSSVKEECLSKVLRIGERFLRLALSEYVAHYHAERNHQGKDNVPLFRRDTQTRRGGPVQCRERLGGCSARWR